MSGDAGPSVPRYRIVVRGELRPDVPGGAGGLRVESTGPTSVLLVDPPDQAALQAALGWLRDAHIHVLSLTRVEAEG
jgi:hypothetical protein